MPGRMNAAKMDYFARANAVRFGMMNTAGALMGLGGHCGPGMREVTSSKGVKVCITEQKAGGSGTSVFQSIKEFFGGGSKVETSGEGGGDSDAPPDIVDTPEGREETRTIDGKKVTTFTPHGEPDAMAAFLARRDKGGDSDELLGMPKWLVIGAGVLLAGGVVLAVARKRK